ncbi:MAG: antibiotic biosynthesis monooxygenase [Lawsonibacter sp.]|nr:antibiotic biosynthesis monooxygenase [Lawsonibacter sp.]
MSYGLNVSYWMKPGKRDRFLELVRQCGLPGAVRGEEGCLGYEYFLSADHPDLLLLVERWTGRDAQEAHTRQPHMAPLAAIKEECLDHSEIERYEL